MSEQELLQDCLRGLRLIMDHNPDEEAAAYWMQGVAEAFRGELERFGYREEVSE